MLKMNSGALEMDFTLNFTIILANSPSKWKMGVAKRKWAWAFALTGFEPIILP